MKSAAVVQSRKSRNTAENEVFSSFHHISEGQILPLRQIVCIYEATAGSKAPLQMSWA